MPIVDVTHAPSIDEDCLHRLAQELPHAVSLAVSCPEEPYDRNLQPGDVVVRFHAQGPFDSGGLDVLVEVRSKWFESRAANRQARCDQLCDAVVGTVGTNSVGVYLTLPIAAWQQGD